MTKASTRSFPPVSKPQCFVKVNLPALPLGLLGVKDVPLLEGQSAVMRGVGVDVKRELKEILEAIGVDVLEGFVAVVELLMVSIHDAEAHPLCAHLCPDDSDRALLLPFPAKGTTNRSTD
jgi:hypothetical protein